MKALMVIILFISVAFGGMIDLAKERMGDQFSSAISIEKKTLILSPSDKKSLASLSKTQHIKTIYHYFVVTQKDGSEEYGFLLSDRVRSKNMVSLCYIDAAGVISGIEVVAFYEPKEYLPKKEWFYQFSGKKAEDNLRIRNNITSITGATLSAKSAVRSGRVAFALFSKVVSKK